MGSSLSRTARIHNGCLDDIMLKVVKDPGGQVIKRIMIPKGGFNDLPYDEVDDAYDKGFQRSIEIFKKGIKCGDVEIVQVRDYQTLKLVMDNEGQVIVDEKQKGLILARLGMSWKVKDAFQNMKRYIGTKPEKKISEHGSEKHPNKCSDSEDVRIIVEES